MQINSINYSRPNFNGVYIVKGPIKENIEITEQLQDRDYSYNASFVDGRLQVNKPGHLLVATEGDKKGIDTFVLNKKSKTEDNFELLKTIFDNEKIKILDSKKVLDAITNHQFDANEGEIIEQQ